MSMASVGREKLAATDYSVVTEYKPNALQRGHFIYPLGRWVVHQAPFECVFEIS